MKRYLLILIALIFMMPAYSVNRKTSSGIILSGEIPEVRAMEPFGGSQKRETAYAQAVNNAKQVLGNGVNVYCMLVPNSCEFYCPAEMKKWTRDQKAAINYVYSKLAPGVKKVDAYSALQAHKNEKIYSRTDHHWAPLGAYYAAGAFARTAGVAFLPLSSYTPRKVAGYVGSMAAFSKDPSVRKSPEDFIYYEPKQTGYKVTFIPYTGNGKVKKEGKPVVGKLLYPMKNGSGSAYCVFMQGDSKIVQIRTGKKTGRRLVILKDSYGNALPSNLIGSFDEIHLIDFRYFNRSLPAYVRENKITDVLFFNNIVHANNAAVAAAYNRFLK